MYHVLNQEYLFATNDGQEIDASNKGNKMRFMNNSVKPEHINVEPKKLLCNGVVRIGLFAARAIKAGEELLYNYNYPVTVTETFWEPGDKPANARRAVPSNTQERVIRTTGSNQMVGVTTADTDEESIASPSVTRSRKRKRALVDRDLSDNEWPAGSVAQVPEIEDSEDSDYLSNGNEDEGVSEVEDDEGEENLSTPPASHRANPGIQRHNHALTALAKERGKKKQSSKKKRKVEKAKRNIQQRDGGHADRSHSSGPNPRKGNVNDGDRRFGGAAQSMAWQTRRKKDATNI
jgi:hypothetical protein